MFAANDHLIYEKKMLAGLSVFGIWNNQKTLNKWAIGV